MRVAHPLTLVVGRLGSFAVPAGLYVYTGSARRNLDARVARHLRADKRLRWHIDHLLAAPGVEVVSVRRSMGSECEWNCATPGSIPIRGFGASDCRSGCGAHLKLLPAAMQGVGALPDTGRSQ